MGNSIHFQYYGLGGTSISLLDCLQTSLILQHPPPISNPHILDIMLRRNENCKYITSRELDSLLTFPLFCLHPHWPQACVCKCALWTLAKQYQNKITTCLITNTCTHTSHKYCIFSIGYTSILHRALWEIAIIIEYRILPILFLPQFQFVTLLLFYLCFLC